MSETPPTTNEDNFHYAKNAYYQIANGNGGDVVQQINARIDMYERLLSAKEEVIVLLREKIARLEKEKELKTKK